MEVVTVKEIGFGWHAHLNTLCTRLVLKSRDGGVWSLTPTPQEMVEICEHLSPAEEFDGFHYFHKAKGQTVLAEVEEGRVVALHHLTKTGAIVRFGALESAE